MCLNMVKKSLHEILFHFSDMGFSTNDQDNDPDSSRHCSQHFKGSLVVRKLPSLQSERIVPQWLPCVLC